jgi:hypothetical protein
VCPSRARLGPCKVSGRESAEGPHGVERPQRVRGPGSVEAQSVFAERKRSGSSDRHGSALLRVRPELELVQRRLDQAARRVSGHAAEAREEEEVVRAGEVVPQRIVLGDYTERPMIACLRSTLGGAGPRGMIKLN